MRLALWHAAHYKRPWSHCSTHPSVHLASLQSEVSVAGPHSHSGRHDALAIAAAGASSAGGAGAGAGPVRELWPGRARIRCLPLISD